MFSIQYIFFEYKHNDLMNIPNMTMNCFIITYNMHDTLFYIINFLSEWPEIKCFVMTSSSLTLHLSGWAEPLDDLGTSMSGLLCLSPCLSSRICTRFWMPAFRTSLRSWSKICPTFKGRPAALLSEKSEPIQQKSITISMVLTVFFHCTLFVT